VIVTGGGLSLDEKRWINSNVAKKWHCTLPSSPTQSKNITFLVSLEEFIRNQRQSSGKQQTVFRKSKGQKTDSK